MIGHKPVDWHVWRSNPLYCIMDGRRLNLADGSPVWLTKPFHFQIEVEATGQVFTEVSCAACCARLKELGVGIAFFPVS